MVRAFLSYLENYFLFTTILGWETGQIFKIYYLKKKSLLGLLDKARFTEGVTERLLTIRDIHIIERAYQFHEVFPYNHKQVFGLVEKVYPCL